MDQGYFGYWGKADVEVGGYHLLPFHALDVAAVAECMLRADPCLVARLGAWLGVDPEVVPPTVAAVVALHDVGKLDARFQVKAPEVALRMEPARSGVRRGPYDHGAQGFRLVWRELRARCEELLGPGAGVLLQAVTGHHGTIPTRGPSQSTLDVPAALRAQDRRARAVFVEDVLACFAARGSALPLAAQPPAPAVVTLGGLCAVADWIGSQVDRFPYRPDPVGLARYYDDVAHPRATQAWDALALRSAAPSGAGFATLFPGKVPRDVQRAVEALELPVGPALYVIEARMGSGKTEAAFALAERLMARGDARGLYVGLPTMATSNAMFDRLRDVAPRLFAGTPSLVLAHGRRWSHPGFAALLQAGAPARRDPDVESASVICARWLAGRKRSLLGQLGVGTVDQAMQAALRLRHHFVRAYALAQSVVVLDEVHAYDVYMEVIIERLVEWLGALRTPVVLLSATLPGTRRAALASAYSKGAGFAPPAATARSPEVAPYPLVTVVSGAGVVEQSTDAPLPAREVACEVVATAEPASDVLPRLCAAARAGAMVGWVRNTVTEAQEAWCTARNQGVPLLLFHARMRGVDRQRIEERVLADFGPSGERRGVLLIATQVIEQSLDLDFDLLATDLAPVDLVLQRAGRLHRHDRPTRPRGCDTPRLIVVAPPPPAAAALDFGHTGLVYDPATLGLSLDVLRDCATLEIPSDVRPLVESVYDPSQRAARVARAPNSAKLSEAEAQREARVVERQTQAHRACIPPADHDFAADETYQDDDEIVQALTRDGDSVTLLPLEWDPAEEVARPLGLSAAFNPNPTAPERFVVARDLLEQTLSVPAYPWEWIERGTRARGEARAWDEWLATAERFFAATGLGEPVVVPMRRSGEAAWKGAVVTSKGRVRRLGYSLEQGLWFRPEDES